MKSLFKNPVKVLKALMAVALSFALTVSAFAAWPSFQNDPSANNGVILTAPYIGPNPTPAATTVMLPYSGSIYTGVDTTSVINDRIAYTVYNGGSDGALLAGTDLTTGNSVWTLGYAVLDATANNGFQLSTPYLNTMTNTLYVGVTNPGSGSTYTWQVYAVTNLTGTAPSVAAIAGLSGSGELNTPISATSDGNYIYFGTYTSTQSGSYYQYDTNSGAIDTFSPKDDFYGAGAAIVPIANAKYSNYAVFGSDSGHIYVTPVGTDFGTTGNTNTIQLVDAIYSPGAIRSTVIFWNESVYFTSRAASDGLLWQIPTTEADLIIATTATTDGLIKGMSGESSTPVISDNEILYVGGNYSSSSGVVVAFDPTSIASGSIEIYSGDPVQASPIVYSVTAPPPAVIDYVYFTTNSGSGKGYCYSFVPSTSTTTSIWTAGGTSSNPYAVQGFASDDGYLVYGDDGNYLYVMH